MGDRFDSQIEDIFDLQDRLTGSVIGAIYPQLERAEIERAQRKPTESLKAYDYYLRALDKFYKYTSETSDRSAQAHANCQRPRPRIRTRIRPPRLIALTKEKSTAGAPMLPGKRLKPMSLRGRQLRLR